MAADGIWLSVAALAGAGLNSAWGELKAWLGRKRMIEDRTEARNYAEVERQRHSQREFATSRAELLRILCAELFAQTHIAMTSAVNADEHGLFRGRVEALHNVAQRVMLYLPRELADQCANFVDAALSVKPIVDGPEAEAARIALLNYQQRRNDFREVVRGLAEALELASIGVVTNGNARNGTELPPAADPNQFTATERA